jgi:hypothetical protein
MIPVGGRDGAAPTLQLRIVRAHQCISRRIFLCLTVIARCRSSAAYVSRPRIRTHRGSPRSPRRSPCRHSRRSVSRGRRSGKFPLAGIPLRCRGPRADNGGRSRAFRPGVRFSLPPRKLQLQRLLADKPLERSDPGFILRKAEGRRRRLLIPGEAAHQNEMMSPVVTE